MTTRTKIIWWLLAFFGPIGWVVPVGLRGREATLSKETTVITSPLTPEGLPDYAAWLNEKYGKGVTPENNAAAVLVHVWNLDDDDYAATCARLGVAPLGKDRRKCVDFQSWAQARLPDGLQDDRLRKAEDFYKACESMEQECRTKPWTALSHPDVAAWLAEQEPCVKALHEAARRDSYWVPWTAGEVVLDHRSPHWGAQRAVENLLSFRVMGLAGEGRFEEAFDEVECARKCARLKSLATPATLDVLLALATEKQAWQMTQALVLALPKDHSAWARAEAMARHPYLDLRQAMFAAVGEGERFTWLDALQRARHSCATGARNGRIFGDNAWIMKEMDMDVCLHRINAYYDTGRFTQDKTDEQHREARERVTAGMMRVQLIPPGWRRSYFGEKFTDFLMESAGGSIASMAFSSIESSRVTHLHLPVGLALAKYRQAHGAFPATLDALVPAYMAQLPESRHGFGTVTYRTAGNGKAFSIAYVKAEDWRDDKAIPSSRYREMVVSSDFDALLEADEKTLEHATP